MSIKPHINTVSGTGEGAAVVCVNGIEMVPFASFRSLISVAVAVMLTLTDTTDELGGKHSFVSLAKTSLISLS